ncbi:MAG: hypothetical protein V1820_00260 [archaeon]
MGETSKRAQQYFPERNEPPELSPESRKDPLNKALAVAGKLREKIVAQANFSEPFEAAGFHEIGKLDYSPEYEKMDGKLRTALGFPKELTSPAELVAKADLETPAIGPVTAYLEFIAEHTKRTVDHICRAVHASGREVSKGLLGGLAEKSPKFKEVYNSVNGFAGRGKEILEGAAEAIEELGKRPYSEYERPEGKEIPGIEAAQKKLREGLAEAFQPEIPETS